MVDLPPIGLYENDTLFYLTFPWGVCYSPGEVFGPFPLNTNAHEHRQIDRQDRQIYAKKFFYLSEMEQGRVKDNLNKKSWRTIDILLAE